jgi:hypothetical protein
MAWLDGGLTVSLKKLVFIIVYSTGNVVGLRFLLLQLSIRHPSRQCHPLVNAVALRCKHIHSAVVVLKVGYTYVYK